MYIDQVPFFCICAERGSLLSEGSLYIINHHSYGLLSREDENAKADPYYAARSLFSLLLHESQLSYVIANTLHGSTALE